MDVFDKNGIEASKIVKSYGKRQVVSGVDLSIYPRKIVELLGPNGAGKTTSFYMIVGLVPVSSGEVFYNGESITRLPMHRRARMGIGYLPQEPSVFRKLTVEDNIKAIVETLPISRLERKKRVQYYLEKLGLQHLSKQKAYTLSGGERRRLEISRALVTNPKYLLMDEPFSGVDPISVEDVKLIIQDLKKENIGILITDHNVRETLSIVDRAYLIHEGKVLSHGTSEELINDPISRQFYLGETFNM